MDESKIIEINPVKGGFSVLSGNTVSIIIDAISGILIARLLSPSNYGLYGITFILPNFFLLFCDYGIDFALTRFIAKNRVTMQHDLDLIQITGIVFKFLTGTILSLSLFFLSSYLSNTILHRTETITLVKFASLIILFQALHGAVGAILLGFERMKTGAILTILKSFSKLLISTLLIILGFGIKGAIIGYTISYVLSSIIGISYIFSQINKLDFPVEKIYNQLVLMLKLGFPFYTGYLIYGFGGQIRGFLLSIMVSNEEFGNYSVATQFFNMSLIFYSSLDAILLPFFSKLNFTVLPEKTSKAFSTSVRYSGMFVVPIMAYAIFFSQFLINMLYTSKYPKAPIFVSLILIPNLFIGMGTISIFTFLSSQGNTNITMKLLIINTIISLILNVPFIYYFGVYGLLISNIISALLNNLISINFFEKIYHTTPDISFFVKTLICSILCSAITFYIINIIPINIELVILFVSGVLFVFIYLLISPFIGAIDKEDVNVIDSTLGDLQLYPIIKPFLNVIKTSLIYKNRLTGINN